MKLDSKSKAGRQEASSCRFSAHEFLSLHKTALGVVMIVVVVVVAAVAVVVVAFVSSARERA